jgi:hypothetical protein
MREFLVILLAIVAVAGFPKAFAQESVQPNFSGTWHFGSLTPLERPDELADQTHFKLSQATAFANNYDNKFRQDLGQSVGKEFVGTDLWFEHGCSVEPDLRTSLIVDPPDGKIPKLTALAQAREDAFWSRRKLFSGPEVLDVSERCITDGVPILTGVDSNYMSILQNDDVFLMVREFINTRRIVHFDRLEPPPKHIRFWNGATIAHWQSDVLYLTTSNFRRDHSHFGSGSKMALTESFELTGPDQIRYEFTIHDEDSFTASWTARAYIHRTDKRRYEFACHEGNYRSMQGILKGSRTLEANARK